MTGMKECDSGDKLLGGWRYIYIERYICTHTHICAIFFKIKYISRSIH